MYYDHVYAYWPKIVVLHISASGSQSYVYCPKQNQTKMIRVLHMNIGHSLCIRCIPLLVSIANYTMLYCPCRKLMCFMRNYSVGCAFLLWIAMYMYIKDWNFTYLQYPCIQTVCSYILQMHSYSQLIISAMHMHCLVTFLPHALFVLLMYS